MRGRGFKGTGRGYRMTGPEGKSGPLVDEVGTVLQARGVEGVVIGTMLFQTLSRR